MGNALAQVRHQGTSGLPEDVYINTFTFSDLSGGSVLLTDAVFIAQQLVIAYSTGDVSPVGTFLSDAVSRGALSGEVRVYDLLELEPRVPVHSEPFTPVAAADNTNMPNEVALCLSFQGVPQAGQSQARRRGRVFMGPLNHQAIDSAAAGNLPGATFREALLDFGEDLQAVIEAGSLYSWTVHSRIANQHVRVDNLWVDNAWDTQRRRGNAPSSRVVRQLT